MQRVTILDIAREAGVSKSTVSRALTNHPRISEKTKSKILGITKRLGYYPDPAMRILCSYRNAKRKNDTLREFPIAIVTDFAEPTKGIYIPSLIADIKEIAVGMGYIISVIDSLEYPQPASVARVLKSRGVRGIIMLAIFREAFAKQFPWEDFAVVLHGQPNFRPHCHMVREDRFEGVVKAIRRAWELGYRRPAFAMVSHSKESRYYDLMSGAYYSEIARLAGTPDLITPKRFSLEDGPEAVRDWVATERPDVIIGENDGVFWRLVRAGLEVPKDVAFASIFRHPDHPEIAGFNMECRLTAETLVRQLDLLIRHDVLEPGEQVSSVLVKRPFEEGATLPPNQDRSSCLSRSMNEHTGAK